MRSSALQSVAAETLMTLEQLRTEPDIATLLGQAAKAEATAKVVEQLIATAEDADQARIELARMALFARYQAGVRLAGVSGGRAGDSKKSPRRVLIESIGIGRGECGRLVRFSKLDEAAVAQAIEIIEAAGRVSTLDGVTTILNKRHRARKLVSLAPEVHLALKKAAHIKGVTMYEMIDNVLSTALGVGLL